MRKDAANVFARYEFRSENSLSKVLISALAPFLLLSTFTNESHAAPTNGDFSTTVSPVAEIGPMKMQGTLPEITTDAFALGWVRPDELIDRPAFSEFGASSLPANTYSDSAALWETEIPGAKAWSDAALRAIAALGPHLFQASVTAIDFCPAFERLSQSQKTSFWVRLLSAMSYRESAWNPAATYREAWTEAGTSQRAISRGLLQLSKGSTDAYGCGFRTDDDVHDPGRNLACGVRILDWWIQRDGRVTGGRSGAWRGGARYWAVLRSSKALTWIRESTRALSFCR